MRMAVGSRVAGRTRSRLVYKEEQGSSMRKDFHPALETAMQHALEYLRTVDERPVGPTASLETLRQAIVQRVEPRSAAGRVRRQ